MKVGVRPAARRDIILQVGYYLEQRAYDAAERFPPAVQEAFAPNSGAAGHRGAMQL